MFQMMDGGPVTDPDIYRTLVIGRVCAGFSCMPSAAAWELDNDPDQLALAILDYRGFMDAKHAFDAATDKVSGLQRWTGNPYMTLVEIFTYEKRIAAAEAGAQANG